jgi:toxin CptA
MNVGQSLRLSLGPSSALTWLLSGGHAAAAILVWVTLPAWGSLAACTVLAGSLVLALGRHARRSAGAAVVEVALAQDGRVDLRRRDGGRAEGRLLPSTFVSPPLVILNLAGDRWRLSRAVLVPADAVGADDHRRLRVWLRWRPVAADKDDDRPGSGRGVN